MEIRPHGGTRHVYPGEIYRQDFSARLPLALSRPGARKPGMALNFKVVGENPRKEKGCYEHT